MRFTAAGFLASCVLASTALGQGMSEGVTDRQITDAVERELWGDEVINANRVDVTTTEGIVTLGGNVSTILTKDRATAIAESVRGVRGIVNQIDVLVAAKSDEDLQSDVEQALLDNRATDSYEVTATVDQGTVTLMGTVDSWQEKQLCTHVVKGVSGVRDVNNRVTVDYDTDRPDAEIKPEIVAMLESDVRVDDYLIDVDVDGGQVDLSGTVGSLAEKRRAISDAWVAGVSSVNADDLEVKAWARDELRRSESYVDRTDQEIQDAITDAFTYDPRVLSYRPDIDVQNGIVTLRGVVADLDAKRAAEQTARNVLGVWRVKNYLKVRPKVVPSNKELERRVGAALLRDPYVERLDIDVDAINGWVYLTGKVHNSFEERQAERVVQGVTGVTGVSNNIRYDYTWTWKPDNEIRDDIEDELFWSPFVDENEVYVSVEDGVATLRGTVDTWSERSAATENAWEGGAKDVRNRLGVTNRFFGPEYPYWDPYSPYAPLDMTDVGTAEANSQNQ